MFDRTRLPYVVLDMLCVLLAGLPCAILTARHAPFQRGLFCNDESIKYPYKEDTIPYALLGGVIIPFSVIVNFRASRNGREKLEFCASSAGNRNGYWSRNNVTVPSRIPGGDAQRPSSGKKTQRLDGMVFMAS